MNRFAVMLAYTSLVLVFVVLLHINVKAVRAYILQELHINVFLF